MSSRIAAICVAVVSTAMLATGCGVDTEGYVETVDEIRVRASDAYNATAAATPEEPKALLDEMEKSEAALEEAVAELRAVDIPEEAREAHPDLVAGFEQLRAAFDESAKQLRSADPSEAFTAITEFSSEAAEIGGRIDQAVRTINEDLGAE